MSLKADRGSTETERRAKAARGLTSASKIAGDDDAMVWWYGVQQLDFKRLLDGTRASFGE